MDELCVVCGAVGLWLLVIVVLRFVVRMMTSDYRVFGYGDPVVLDPDNPRDQHEARCIEHQMTTGRELNGYVWKDKNDE
jgi:hypothetical protein